ncbi:MAG TPA: radical SAM protein, partial [Candidatus Cloacimonas sp.]|nr:radical SAM protein [Candidatus Cloacimonas sp.]
CFARHQKKLGEIFPRDAFIRFMADAPRLGVKSVAIIGDGEPLLNPALCEGVMVGKKNGLDISIGSNGIALTPEKASILLSRCVWFRFNLSAASKEAYQKIHGVDKWEVVKKNIEDAVRVKRLNDYDCTIGLQMVLVPDCLDQVIPEAKFAIDTGVDYFVIKQFSDPVCEEMTQFDMSFYDKDKVNSILKEAESMSTKETQIIPKWNIIHSKGSMQGKCVDLPLLIEGSGTGKFYPCGYHFRNPKYELGDLTKQTFQEMVESFQYWKVIKEVRDNLVVGADCKGACRHLQTNAFLNNYLNKPEHINFI